MHPQLTLLAGIIPAMLFVVYKGGNIAIYLFLALVTGSLTSVYGPNGKSILM